MAKPSMRMHVEGDKIIGSASQPGGWMHAPMPAVGLVGMGWPEGDFLIGPVSIPGSDIPSALSEEAKLEGKKMINYRDFLGAIAMDP